MADKAPRRKYPSDLGDRYVVRFPDGMHGQLKIRAAAHRRSMNSEIVEMLANVLNDQQKTVAKQTA